MKWDGTNWIPSEDIDTNSTYTAENGITLDGSVFKLGGTLSGNTTINLDSAEFRIEDGDFIVENNIFSSELRSTTIYQNGNEVCDMSGNCGIGDMDWTLAADSGPSQTIDPADTVTFAGGTGLSSVASAIDTVTLNIGQGAGITVGADDIAVDQSYAFAWTGAQSWSNSADFNGDVSFADTDIVFDGASTNLSVTGNFSINTNDIFVQKSDGNVGIGTNTPDFAFQVNGTVAPEASDQDLGTASLRWDVFANTIDADSTITLTGLGTGTDNTVLILNAANQVTTDEIDSRVWGSTLVDGGGTAGYVTYWSDTNTLTGEAQLAISRGGTNSTATPTAGAVAYGTGTAYAFSSAGLAGQPLLSGGAGTPTFGTLGLTYGGTNADLSSLTTGELIYMDGSGLAGSGALSGVLKGNGAAAPTAMTGITNYVTRWTDSETLGTGVLYDDNTNVGVGTTSPSSFKLEIAGSVGPSVNDTYDLGSAAQYWNDIYTDRICFDGGSDCMSSTNSDSMWTRTGTDVHLTNIGDNVGIGTDTPVAKFDVRDGNFSLTNSNVSHGLTTILSSTNSYGELGPINGNEGGLHIQGASDVAAATGLSLRGIIGSADPTDTVAAVTLVGAKKNGTTIQDLGASETVLQIRNNATNLMTVLGNGNIGIGSTVPGQTLDVVGNVRISGLTASRAVFTNGSKDLVTSALSAALLDALTDETGTGVAVFNTSPTISTSLLTNSTSFDLLNTTATTINFGGAASTLNIGPGSTTATSVNLAGGSAATGCTVDGATGNLECSGTIIGVNTVGFWQYANGAISPSTPYTNNTDLLVGSNATDSAKFAFINVMSGTPTASVSTGVSGTSMFMTADGTLATSNRSSLTIGNSTTSDTTGNVYINPNGTGNVGIGTTTTGYKLQVMNTAGIVGDNTGAHLTVTETSDNVGFDASTSIISDSASILMRANTLDFPAAGTFLGLPRAALAEINATEGHSRSISAFAIGTDQAIPLVFGNSDTARMTILPGGNIGVGTSAPTNFKLEVAGNIGPSANDTYNLGSGTQFFNDIYTDRICFDGAVDCLTSGSANGIWTRTGTNVHLTNIGDNVGIGSSAPNAKLTIGSNIATGFLDTYSEYQIQIHEGGTPNLSYGLGIKNSTIVFNSGGGAYSFDKGGNQTQMVIDTAGNVGIGSTAPTAKLDVVYTAPGGASDEVGARIRLDNGGTHTGARTFTALRVESFPAGSGVANAAEIGLHVSLRGVQNTGNPIAAIFENGYVGIGTTVPNAKLTVYNNVATGFLNNYSEYQLMLYDGSNGGISYGLGVKSNTLVFNSGAGAYSFDRAGNATSMVIDTGGNVGIGTTVPATTLNVVGTNEIARFGGGTVPFITIGNAASSANGAYIQWDDTNNKMNISPHGITAMSILNNGNVGINATTPLTKLHIIDSVDNSASSIISDTQGMLIDNGVGVSGAYSTLKLGTGGSDGAWIAAVHRGNNVLDLSIGKYTSSGQAMNWIFGQDDGDVGIGTTSPAGNLDVTSTTTTDGYWLDGKLAVSGETADNWLRLNQSGSWTNGVYTPLDLRVDGVVRFDGVSDLYYSGTTSRLAYQSGDVDGTDIRFEDSDGTIHGYVFGDGNGANFGLLDGDGNWAIRSVKDTSIDFWVNNSQKMIIETSGDVGIAATAPLSKLAVGGNGVASTGIYGTAVQNGVYGVGFVGVRGDGGDIGVYGDGDWGVYADGGTYGVFASGVQGVNATGTSHGVRAQGGTNGVEGSGTGSDFLASGPGVNYNVSSSIRWKKDLQPINNALDKVLALRGLYYTWDEAHGGKRDMGFIAEEVRVQVPEVVANDPTAPGFAVGMDYGAMTPILVEAIKEQQGQINNLKSATSQNLSLTSSGDLSITGQNETYTVTAMNGSPITNIISASQAVVGKMTAGLVNTKELVVQKTATIADLRVTNLTVSGQSINTYIRSIVQSELQNPTTALPADAIAQDFNSGMVINNYNTTVTIVQSPTSSTSASTTYSATGSGAIANYINVTEVTQDDTKPSLNILAGLISWSEATFDGLRTLFFNTPTAFKYLAWFQGPVKVNADTSGMIMIPANTLKARVSFSKSFPETPTIYVNFNESMPVAHTITDVNQHGFTINFADAPSVDLNLQWLALLRGESEAGPSLEVMEKSQGEPAKVLPTPTPAPTLSPTNTPLGELTATPSPEPSAQPATPSSTGLSNLVETTPVATNSATPSGEASPSAQTP